TLVDVAFQSSTNGGASWSPIAYLGNENCTAGVSLADAWQPSLTSLANGTFVLTYIEFNISACNALFFFCNAPVPPDVFPYQMPNSALVVQESYNGGASWTAPAVLNQTFNATAEQDLCGLDSGSPLYHPWISASGAHLFLAYENLSDANGCSLTHPYSAGVHLIASNDGGRTWGAPVNFPTVGDGGVPVSGFPTNLSVNPVVLAAPNGQVYVAYATGLEGPATFCEASGCTTSGTETADIAVANSSGGNGTWTVHFAAANAPFNASAGSAAFGATPFSGLHPQLAYDGRHGQLDLVYNSESVGRFCFSVTAGAPTCVNGTTANASVFQNSSNGGANWSAPTLVGTLVDPYGGGANSVYSPAISVGPNGTAFVTEQFFNDSVCGAIAGTAYCGAYVQVELITTNNGTSWTGPSVLSAFGWVAPNRAFTGESTTAATAPSGATYFAWTDSTCRGSTAPVCRFASPLGAEPNTTVVVSSPYTSPGVTITFHEANLTAGDPWSVDVVGNVRSALAGTNLVVAGAPPTEPLTWAVSWANISYGVAWQPLAAPSNPRPPATFAASSTLNFTYQELVRVGVSVRPALPSAELTAGSLGATYAMSPLPGTTWVAVNATLPLSVSSQGISCVSVCNYENLTWTSWTGTGPGSVSTSALNATLHVATSPVNETANFLDNGPCVGASGSATCTGPYGYPLEFVETGLPSGTGWGVTVVANASATFSITSTTPWANATIGQTPASYTVWTVPAISGHAWVANASPGPTVQEPGQSLVNVTFSLVNTTSATFLANFTAAGLPNRTAWSAEVGPTSYAVTAGNLTVPVAGGTPLVVNGSDVYTEAGVAFYAASVLVEPYAMNATVLNTSNLTTPIWFNASARVVVSYLPMFRLTVSASVGGTTTPASRWVESGSSVVITATPDPGYFFLDWAGAGAGSSTALQAHSPTTTIAPTGAVTELATFRKVPEPTWNVTVSANGLPSAAALAFTLGNTSYSGLSAGVTVGELPNGSYAFTPLLAYANASNGTRWVPTTWSSPFGPARSSPLAIHSDGAIVVNFTTEYTLTVAAGAGGTVTPATAVGSLWDSAGAVVALTASPSYHYEFTGWNGTGASAVRGASPAISVTVDAPTWETATFAYRVFPPPAVFTLRVVEHGLPSGTTWSVATSTGSASASGSGNTLLLGGLNGSYSLTVPAVFVGAGTRFVELPGPPALTNLTANGSMNVAFGEQFLLTVLAGAGGAVAPNGTTWQNSGAGIALSAHPSAGFAFVGWNGSQPSGYTGSDPSGKFTMDAPVNESATFAPVPASHANASTTTGEGPALGLLAALLVVGIVVGLLVGRPPRRPPAEASSGEPDSGGHDGSGSDEPMANPTPTLPE
ncbi:MAG: hypothetical protein L3K05_02760, partial [Thermoplasmata archaeon]|nr:hypothetical protein [Thermoplasmata archaeon]